MADLDSAHVMCAQNSANPCWDVALLRENLDDIAIREAVPQRNDLAVHLCAMH